jgi:molecular chaperone Hsp33
LNNADFKQRFLFPDTDIRGELVRLDESLEAILGTHDYPLAVQGLVGEAVAAVALLAGTLKFSGRLSLQAQGRGPVSLLLAECTHDGQLRALARHDGDRRRHHGDHHHPGPGPPVPGHRAPGR